MSTRRVLVFPAGTEIGLEIYQALKNCKEVELYGAGQAISNHAPFVYECFFELPNINDPSWLDALVTLCLKLKIDYIFPAYDDVIVALAQNLNQIPSVVLTSPLEVSRITRSKLLTYKHLASIVRVPKLYNVDTVREFPLLIKPDRGQGSQGVTLVNNRLELENALQRINDPIISEYLPGEEFTVDCFSDREKGLLFCGARVRLRMRNGIAVHTQTVDLPQASEIATRIQSVLQLRGAWFFQLKRAKDGDLALLEIAPRIAGSMSTHRVKGVNFPLLTIFEHERLPIQLLMSPVKIELDRALQNRFRLSIDFEALYIDLDDTLILRDRVNLDALRLVYSCINKKIPVILITRHADDLHAMLARHRLTNLFDEVVHITNGECKSNYIRHSAAIFIDDSFSERKRVHDILGIPTFDCSMIEGLICNPDI
ncbi:ATP-grasp domain-containing protein [Nitrosomonas sp.]|uniref:ATP-grasp domain-containing protein n=1 Tax=Nitrosomonas sp. TaxID=42353 RepID=UPI002639820B|nr:ATP-grasp domain-containing protein [Nitrosomonas sp.]MBE7527841.1 ATP-grasp domain-containing protein [Burkholderiales bacterium]